MELKQTHIPYGFVSGLAMAILGLILYVAGLAFKPGMQYLSYLPFAIGIILNAMAFSRANEHYVTFGQVFSSGFKASAIVAIVSLLWAFLMIFIFPDFKEQAIDNARQQMEKNPKMDEEQIEAAINMTRKYWNVFMVGGAIFLTMFWGAIFSLIAAAIAKKKGDRMPPAQVM